MHKIARLASSFLLATVVTAGMCACTVTEHDRAGAQVAALECTDLMPLATVAEILTNPSEDFVRVESPEAEPVNPLVDEMVTDGIACGSNSDSVVFIGALAMDRESWSAAQADFAADGFDSTDDLGITGWVSVPKPHDDPIATSGFAWTDGVLYYAVNPLVFSLMPAFAV
jgi:hypothetical protein